jgi:hypothetical protein
MGCKINNDIINCLYITNEISKFYIGAYTPSISVSYDPETDKIKDMYTPFHWIEIKYTSISIQTDYSNQDKLYSTACKLTINELPNLLELYMNQKRKLFILFLDKNGNAWVDGVIRNDNKYNFANIAAEISNDNNLLSFDLIKTSPYDIKQIDNNYFTFNNL